MSLFTIDTDSCKRDGLCAAACPLGCIALDAEGYPIPHERKQAYCIGCGHCMAVCPTQAIRLDRFDDTGELLDRKNAATPEQVVQLLKGRRSVRAFKKEPLPEETLRELLDLTEYAPSGHNAHPVRWSVAATPERVAEAARATVDWMRGEVEAETERAAALHLAGIVKAWDRDIDIVCREAPALAVAHGPATGITPMEDGVIATAYLELAAHGLGLGACWCGYVQMAAGTDAALRELLGIPEEGRVYGALLLGRPARRYRFIPPRPGANVHWV
ncbi:nitroreductase [Pseudodesulfovibrio cashew]|uniref:Nitroreductase n=1 Tax=Pseudodesulfovibrio cashew TaxID=2678688 RepID=A0A6I6JDI9_9BACT|nr:nitroreductase family protein [Pseudodesulfovibrio cashew]QGY40191.1 nitroreductase [Pseudodesulfovibrio cashew]